MPNKPISRRDFARLGIAVATLPLGLVGSPSDLISSPARAEEVNATLRVSTFRQTSYFTAYYLEKFAPPRLKIEIVETKSNSDALDALLTGDTDVAYMGVIAGVIAVAGGRPIKAVASAGSRTTRILVRTDSDLREIKDLKNKDVALAKGTNQDIIFRELVRQAGLDPMKDINYILLPTDAHVQALVSGTVVAVATAEPFGSMLLMNGTARELITDFNHTRVGNPGILVAVKEDTINKRPEVAQAVVTLHARTVVWMHHNMDQVIGDFAKLSRLNKEIIKMAMSNTAHHYNIDEKYLNDVSGLVSSLRDWKYMVQPFDARKAFDLQFLPAARTAAGEVF
jgi:ABC-type nitrate/sulfonate/bicarbonate transport system substrate-binding protein